MQMTTLQDEAAFADREYSAHEGELALSEVMLAKYANPAQSWDWRQFAARLLGEVRGRSLLDYGCGMGEEAACFAKLGAKVTAIDASPVGVRLTQERARHNGVEDNVAAMVMDATATNFPENRFDLVHGLGILHHVGVDVGLAEVHRVMKPGASGVFLEPLGNVRMVEWCKGWLHRRLGRRLDLTPVTEHEENLKMRDIRAAAGRFSTVHIYPYRLLYRARKLIAPARLHPLLERCDHSLLKWVPFLRPLAGAAVIHVVK